MTEHSHRQYMHHAFPKLNAALIIPICAVVFGVVYNIAAFQREGSSPLFPGQQYAAKSVGAATTSLSPAALLIATLAVVIFLMWTLINAPVVRKFAPPVSRKRR